MERECGKGGFHILGDRHLAKGLGRRDLRGLGSVGDIDRDNCQDLKLGLGKIPRLFVDSRTSVVPGRLPDLLRPCPLRPRETNPSGSRASLESPSAASRPSDTERAGLKITNRAARDQKIQGVLRADESGKFGDRPPARNQAMLNLGSTDLKRRRRGQSHPSPACEGQLEPPTQADSMENRDRRHGKSGQVVEHGQPANHERFNLRRRRILQDRVEVRPTARNHPGLAAF